MIKRFSTLLILIVAILIAVLLGMQAGKYFGRREKLKQRDVTSKQFTSAMKALNIGDTLPNHKFELIEGDSVWLSELFSKKCVLIVSLPQCQDCIYEAQQLQAALKDTVDSKYFIFVTWENPKLLEDIKNEYKLSSPFLYDHKMTYFSQFDISIFPLNLTLDENGIVLDMLAGSMVKEDFEEIIAFNKRASFDRD